MFRVWGILSDVGRLGVVNPSTKALTTLNDLRSVKIAPGTVKPHTSLNSKAPKHPEHLN